MRKAIIVLFTLGLAYSITSRAQKIVSFDLKKTTPVNCTVDFRGDVIHLINQSQKTALLWFNSLNFKNGTIELDLKGKDVRGESFLGVAFRGVDDSTYSAIYFRPFNFNSSDRKTHSVQYIDLPGNDWDLLREKFPAKYEGTVSSVPDANAWFHARIIVEFPLIKVFINDSQEPSLIVNQINNRKDGKLGLWLDSKDGWFGNLKITRK